MTSKSEIGYKQLFDHVKVLVGTQPENIIMDFEKALNNSTAMVFDRCKIFGCNFHFGQIIWSNIQKLGLSVVYKKPSWQRGILKRCFHFAFIPIEHVLLEFEKISQKAREYDRDDRIMNFLIYFRKQFIAGENQPEPAYAISFWSCFLRIQNSIARTTNSLEGWHRQLNSSHPNLAIFLNVLCREEQRSFVKMTQIKSGNYIELSCTDLKKEEELKVAVQHFEEFEIVDFFNLLEKLINFKSE